MEEIEKWFLLILLYDRDWISRCFNILCIDSNVFWEFVFFLILNYELFFVILWFFLYLCVFFIGVCVDVDWLCVGFVFFVDMREMSKGLVFVEMLVYFNIVLIN